MKLTVLTENTANKRGMKAEHGLSLWIEACDRKIIFDTGQSDVWRRNADKLGISVKDADAFVFSHGHYDHCGGLNAAYDIVAKDSIPVFVGKGALEHKYSKKPDGSLREIGADWGVKAGSLPIRETEGFTELWPDVFLLGQIPKLAEFEGVSEQFVRENGEPDPMTDEQMLLIRENGKIHVVAGCCHVGIVSCLTWVKQHFPDERLGLVFAGMHLRSASQERIAATIEAIRQLNPELLVPAHCTGPMAAVQMKLAFGEQCKLAEAGKVFLTQ